MITISINFHSLNGYKEWFYIIDDGCIITNSDDVEAEPMHSYEEAMKKACEYIIKNYC